MFNFKTAKGVYLIRIPDYRDSFSHIASYVIYNATKKTARIINYEYAIASTYDAEIEAYIIKDHEKFLVSENEQCFYMDEDGNISPYDGDLFSMRNKKIKIIHQKEDIRSEQATICNWEEFESFCGRKNYKKGENELIISNGDVIKLPYKIKDDFDRLLLIYKDIPNRNGDMWNERLYGFCDYEGNIIVEPKYDSIWCCGFRKGLGLYQVEIGERHGIVNKEGIEILPPIYGFIWDCDGKVAIIDDGILLDIKSQKVIYEEPMIGGIIKDGWIRVSNIGVLKTDGTFYPISVKDRVNVPVLEWGKYYDEIGIQFCNGLLPVYDSKRGYGYVNEDSIEVIRCKYNEIHPFVDGKAKVRYDVDFGTIDTDGNIIVKKDGNEIRIPNKYDWAYDFENGISIVQKGTLYGCVDGKLNELMPCVFHSAEDVRKVYKKIKISIQTEDYQEMFLDSETPIPYEENQLYGFKRIDGKILCPPIFSVAHKFVEGMALVGYNDKMCYLNENLEMAIPFVTRRGEDFSEGLALIGSQYINKKGECVIKTDHHIVNLKSFSGGEVHCEYNWCEPHRDNDDYVLTKRICGFE